MHLQSCGMCQNGSFHINPIRLRASFRASHCTVIYIIIGLLHKVQGAHSVTPKLPIDRLATVSIVKAQGTHSGTLKLYTTSLPTEALHRHCYL